MMGENGVWPPLPSRPVCTCRSGGKRQNSISHVVLVEGIRIPKCRGMTSFLPSGVGLRRVTSLLIEQRQVDRVPHFAISAIARVHAVAAILLSAHLGQDLC